MFDGESDDEKDNEQEEDAGKFLKKKHGLVSLGQLLQGSSSEDEEDNQDEHLDAGKSRPHTSVYIDNTDSE